MTPERNSALGFLALALALLAATEFALPNTPLERFAVNSYDNLGNVVGLSVGVPENEYNSLAQQFTQKEKELDQRERDLLAKEQALMDEYDLSVAASNRTVLLVLVGVTTLLLLLLMLNFYLDWKRKETESENIQNQKMPHRGELQTRL